MQRSARRDKGVVRLPLERCGAGKDTRHAKKGTKGLVAFFDFYLHHTTAAIRTAQLGKDRAAPKPIDALPLRLVLLYSVSVGATVLNRSRLIWN